MWTEQQGEGWVSGIRRMVGENDPSESLRDAKKEQQLLHIFCQENIYIGQLFKILIEINFTHTTQIASLTGFFEGKFRTKISNQIEFQQIVAFRIEFDSLIRQWLRRNGEIHASPGKHITETELVIGEECPGSYSGKYGSIEYLITVKLCFSDHIGYSELIQECPVRVIAQMDITRYPSYHMPVHIERNFHKKFFCFNKLSIKVLINLSRAAFVRG
ncbi:unnamed protein product [Onchocerca ochengi]|uniref:Arrestin_N domain-containing protein n=1 Tax=Onchocerca ochengi TaxID=42157 RepID=A0A182ECU5_ONCOC|nr:unnamed protein product [Onchocerca ochengi]